MSAEASKEQMLKYLTDSMEVVTNTLLRNAAQGSMNQAQVSSKVLPSKAAPSKPAAPPAGAGVQPHDTAARLERHKQILHKQIIQNLSASHLAAHRQLLSPPPSVTEQQQQQLKTQQKQLIQREIQARLHTPQYPKQAAAVNSATGAAHVRASSSDVLPHLPSSHQAHRHNAPASVVTSSYQHEPGVPRYSSKPHQPLPHPQQTAGQGGRIPNTQGLNKPTNNQNQPIHAQPVRKTGTVPLTEAALKQLPVSDKPGCYRHVASEVASHADWWRLPHTGMSEMSYPRTAVTERESVSPSEFALWESKMNELERTLREEREKRLKFEQDLKYLQSVAASRGSLTTGMATAGDRPRLNAGQIQMAQQGVQPRR